MHDPTLMLLEGFRNPLLSNRYISEIIEKRPIEALNIKFWASLFLVRKSLIFASLQISESLQTFKLSFILQKV